MGNRQEALKGFICFILDFMGGKKGRWVRRKEQGPDPYPTTFPILLLLPANDFSHVFSVRKAAKREILLCDFEGCGKIFSNRQYLNVSAWRDWLFLERWGAWVGCPGAGIGS